MDDMTNWAYYQMICYKLVKLVEYLEYFLARPEKYSPHQ